MANPPEDGGGRSPPPGGGWGRAHVLPLVGVQWAAPPGQGSGGQDTRARTKHLATKSSKPHKAWLRLAFEAGRFVNLWKWFSQKNSEKVEIRRKADVKPASDF